MFLPVHARFSLSFFSSLYVPVSPIKDIMHNNHFHSLLRKFHEMSLYVSIMNIEPAHYFNVTYIENSTRHCPLSSKDTLYSIN